MMELITISPGDIAGLPTHKLRELLTQSLELTAKHLVMLGQIWVELEDRGEDLSQLRSGIATYLPLIGTGKLAAEAVVAFAGQQILLREITLLPIEKQKELANGGKVPLVTVGSSGEHQTSMVDLNSLHVRHYPQIFQDGRLLSEQEQKLLIDSKPKRRRRQRAVRSKKIAIADDVISVGGIQIKVDEMLNALKNAGKI